MIKHPVSEKTAQDFIDNVYQDRGMMKWRGFMLSDHVDKLEKDKLKKQPVKLKQQTNSIIASYLSMSYEKNLNIIIQFNYVDNGYPVELSGFVAEFTDNTFIFVNKKDKDQEFDIKDVRNIRIV